VQAIRRQPSTELREPRVKRASRLNDGRRKVLDSGYEHSPYPPTRLNLVTSNVPIIASSRLLESHNFFQHTRHDSKGLLLHDRQSQHDNARTLSNSVAQQAQHAPDCSTPVCSTSSSATEHVAGHTSCLSTDRAMWIRGWRHTLLPPQSFGNLETGWPRRSLRFPASSCSRELKKAAIVIASQCRC
jgi:hypothetical protein